jgi:sugar lactone lactonase YvrE
MTRRLRKPMVLAAALSLAATMAVAMPAMATSNGQAAGATSSVDELFPTTIALPNGFRPEGIAIGTLPFAFFGSLADGDIYRANLVTGNGRVISEGPGTPSVGMKLDDRGRLFVAGGSGGDARVVSAITGRVLASYTFATAPTFVNDVVLTPTAAWFTDSMQAVLYKVPFGPFGSLPDQSGVVTVPLTGDWVQQPGFNANGITRTPDGRALIVVQSVTATLFRVETDGVATAVTLTGGDAANGDGLLLEGSTLFVVQNQLNRVEVINLNRRGTRGDVVALLTDPRFDVPTTVASFGRRLYLPNARFSTTPTPDTVYTANAIPKP